MKHIKLYKHFEAFMRDAMQQFPSNHILYGMGIEDVLREILRNLPQEEIYKESVPTNLKHPYDKNIKYSTSVDVGEKTINIISVKSSLSNGSSRDIFATIYSHNFSLVIDGYSIDHPLNASIFNRLEECYNEFFAPSIVKESVNAYSLREKFDDILVDLKDERFSTEYKDGEWMEIKIRKSSNLEKFKLNDIKICIDHLISFIGNDFIYQINLHDGVVSFPFYIDGTNQKYSNESHGIFDNRELIRVSIFIKENDNGVKYKSRLFN